MFENGSGFAGAGADRGTDVSVLERRLTTALYPFVSAPRTPKVDLGEDGPVLLLDPGLLALLRRRPASPARSDDGGPEDPADVAADAPTGDRPTTASSRLTAADDEDAAPLPDRPTADDDDPAAGPDRPVSVGEGLPDVGPDAGDGDGASSASVPAWAAVPVGAVPAAADIPGDDPAARARRADAVAAAALEALPGGPGLATALAALSPADVGDATLIEGIAAYERLASWATAQQAVLVRELTDRHGTTGTAAKTAAAEIGARLGSTGTVGAMKVDLAAALDSFPEVADALTTGRIDSRKATVLTTREPGLTTGQQRRVVTGLLKDADRLSGPKLRNRLRAAALSINPDAGVERRQREHAARKVTITPAPDAMAWITAYVRADHAHTVKTALRALADAAVDGDDTDPRSRDQVQADAFVDLFASVLDRGVDLAGHPLPSGRLARAGAQITVGAGTLLGLDHQAGYLAGYGPIPAELARELAQDATWRALLTDEHGHFKDLSTKAYRPGADLTRTVKARDITCTFPGCTRPSVVCDLDHRIAYDPAIAHLVAQTSVCNLHPLCRHHHNLKTTKRWHVRREPDGTVIWTVARTGHQYRHIPDPPAGAPAAANRWADLFANTDPPF
ncbi:uncharacterized protein DUF222 [Georgenia soli]|uniref:Uncharacterized protein DUF222 n=1 Tax=Georgenia soli TaxID=638953 RepID=A0A2A9EIR6_9MICO|nr:HNH endonuclease signature motif containing protein [Georgenia soli]PFG38140.1 uncharacterized protein DUF222 [Georgenia soli]